MRYTLHQGDNREVLKTFPDNSIDSIVTDPPYELGFMGKKWDSSGIAYDQSLWEECLRVLKPGGHLIAFGGTRTYHRMTVAIEDAGFEIRDCIQWIYGSGFPKSHDVSKAIDKQAGVERSEFYTKPIAYPDSNTWGIPNHNSKGNNIGFTTHGTADRKDMDGHGNIIKSLPATPEAQQWHGFGTALKPAVEPAVLARKPLSGTVADNVLTWGVGAINIDGCRIPSDDGFEKAWDKPVKTNISNGSQAFDTGVSAQRGTHEVDISANKPIGGRWPANVILDEEAAQMLDEQSGHGTSRFFYVAKASKSEREAGLNRMEMRKGGGMKGTEDGTLLTGSGNERNAMRANFHPTVKPIELMRYLVRLVTPPNGVVLDPFMGSGSTGCAAMLENMQFVGIELNQEYVDIAEKRIRLWLAEDFMS
jgi:site-specific DNA-methyltransferase (adenine-specific)